MEIVVAEVVEPPPRPWGFWATLGWSALVIMTLVVVQVMVVVAFMMVQMAAAPKTNPVALAQELSTDGFLLAIASWMTAATCLPLTAVLVKLRPGWSVREYLALDWVSGKVFAQWLAFVVLFLVVFQLPSPLRGRPLIQEYSLKTYETARWLPLLWSALLLAAPLFEELFFRGFMYRGIANSRLGDWGAIVITSLAWTAMHLQYKLSGLSLIFLGGLLFGAARWKSRSVYVTVAMHFVWNLISVLVCEMYLRRWG